jgi:hypothetical protein
VRCVAQGESGMKEVKFRFELLSKLLFDLVMLVPDVRPAGTSSWAPFNGCCSYGLGIMHWTSVVMEDGGLRPV